MSDRFHHLFVAAQDYDASLGFYRDVLGWVVTHHWGGNGAERGAILSGGGVKVVIAEKAPTAQENPRPRLHLDIHSVDKRFEAIPKGPHVVTQPEETQWGTRWFVVKDPDGNLIAFEEVHGHGG
jgi:catechol 2,3-dioxygenase-like lactoylglutathione lyase family enzyme